MTNDSDDDLLKTGGALGVFAEVTGGGDEQFVGRDLGDYRITGLIAEGGMSRVYRAERTDGSFEREVAVKVSPVSGFNDRMRERFVQEQGVLAGLNHPNISQLYDTQVTEEGWPYIVMELVDGGSIDEFGAEKSIDDQVRLLIDVVDAVAFAHARLVVHRDIKPSNVLVNEDGRPKLLDFGIAKLLEGEERDLTKAGPMTPRFASPEQLLGQTITTASDIYQLGLLMYQVLTGEPLNEDEMLTDAIQRAAGDRALSVSAAARERIPKELILIIEQCLRVSADERYRDANALKDDLQAYLDGYPVSAAGQSTGYRLGKFVSRNRPAVLIAAAAAVAIIGGSAWYTWQLTEARDLAERRAATSNRVLQTMSQLVADTFSGLVDANAERNAGDESYVERVLQDTVAVIDRELAEEPEARAELLRVQGTIDTILGNNSKAAEALAEAYDLVDRTQSPEIAVHIMLERIEVASRMMDMDTAREMLNEAMEMAGRHSFDTDTTAHLRHQSGQVLQFEGQYELALQEFEVAVDILERQEPVNTQLLASTYEELAYTYSSWDKHEEAISAAETAIDILESSENSVSHRLINPLRFAGFSLLRINQVEKARASYERALSIAHANFGNIHPDVAAMQDSLGALAYQERQFSEAAAHFEEMIRIVTLLDGPDATNLMVPKLNAAVIYTDLGNLDKAGQYFGEVLAGTTENEPELKRFRLAATLNEGRRRYALGDYVGAVNMYREGLALASELLGDDSFETIRAKANLAAALVRAGETDFAEPMFETSIQHYGDTWGFEEGYELFATREWLIDQARGDIVSARLKLTRYLTDKAEQGDLEVIYWTQLFGELATICMTQGDVLCAKEALDRGKIGAQSAPKHPWAIYIQVVEARYLMLTGSPAEAKTLAEMALRALEDKYPLRTDDIRQARAIIDS